MIEIKIDTQKLSQEKSEINKAINNWFHHHSLDSSLTEGLYQNHTEDILGDLTRKTSISDEVAYLLSRQTYERGGAYGSYDYIIDAMDPSKEYSRTMGNAAAEYLSLLVRRSVAIDLLVNKYSKINANDILDSQAVQQANRKFDRVQTNIGWHNSISFEVGTPGSIVSYNETEYKTSMSKPYYYFNCKIGIDRSFITDVIANKIEIVDIAGKDYLTVSATEIPEHELKDEGIRLFQAKLISTKVSQDMDPWCLSKDDGKKILQFEDRIIAVQEHQSGARPTVTTGKNQSWAIRTMKGRMKKHMMKMMDVW